MCIVIHPILRALYGLFTGVASSSAVRVTVSPSRIRSRPIERHVPSSFACLFFFSLHISTSRALVLCARVFFSPRPKTIRRGTRENTRGFSPTTNGLPYDNRPREGALAYIITCRVRLLCVFGFVFSSLRPRATGSGCNKRDVPTTKNPNPYRINRICQ